MSLRLLLVLPAVLALGCGAGPTPRPLIDDVFHDVYLRGAPSPGGRGRVALTVPGPGPCTDRLLAVAAEHGLALTVMVDAAALDAAEGPALKATLARIDTDGHGLGLAPRSLPADWQDPVAFRQGLAEITRAVRAHLTAHGIEAPPLRAWRPPSADRATLAAARAAERPIVLWSLRAPGGPDFAPALPALLDRLTDGDIVALPAGDRGACPAADGLPRVAAALKAAALDAVPLDALLAPHAARYGPPRVVRFRGPPPSAACRALAGAPPEDPVPEQPLPPPDAARWGLVHAVGPGEVTALPVGGDEGTAALLADRGRIDRLWAARAAWAARPACLRTIPIDRLLPPITPTRGAAPIGWWSVGAEAIERREPRAIGAPGGPTLLPDRADLARFEARQKVPWAARGVVAGALEMLGLDVPLLTELRSTLALVIGARLTPDAADDDAAIRRAIAAYAPVAELSMGEYLFLAESLPAAANQLRRTARAADGFLRPGPMLVLAAPGRGPDPGRLGLDGGATFGERPVALVRRLLADGRALEPGDVVAAAPPPPRGAPLVFATGRAESMGAALRTALGRSLLVAMMLPIYLRPGATRGFDGDLFGRWRLRVAVPAGVAAPATEARPLGQRPREEAADDAPANRRP